jgi:hypothetical protein
MVDLSSVAGPNVAIIFVRLGIVVTPPWLKTIKKTDKMRLSLQTGFRLVKQQLGEREARVFNVRPPDFRVGSMIEEDC